MEGQKGKNWWEIEKKMKEILKGRRKEVQSKKEREIENRGRSKRRAS